MLPFVTVIIPVYNDSKRLLKCLQALSLQSYNKNNYEILVVDNGSTEDIRKVTDNFSQVKYVFELAKGPAAARNKGIEKAKGDVLAFTDSDCIPDKDWIKNGVSTLMSVPGCGLVAGKIVLFYKDSNRVSAIELYDTISYLQQERYINKYRFSATANLFTFKNVIKKVGVFNSVLFKTAAGEDADWGQRVYAAGYNQVYAENAYVLHPATALFSELYRKTARITSGNIVLNDLRGKEVFINSFKSLFDSICFHYNQIWSKHIIKRWQDKFKVSFLAIIIIGSKALTKLFEKKNK